MQRSSSCLLVRSNAISTMHTILIKNCKCLFRKSTEVMRGNVENWLDEWDRKKESKIEM